jgi:hypothetical protein
MWDKILYVFGKSVMPACFIALLISRYNNQLLPLLRQFLLTSNRINEFMDVRVTPCFNQFCWDLISTW